MNVLGSYCLECICRYIRTMVIKCLWTQGSRNQMHILDTVGKRMRVKHYCIHYTL